MTSSLGTINDEYTFFKFIDVQNENEIWRFHKTGAQKTQNFYRNDKNL